MANATKFTQTSGWFPNLEGLNLPRALTNGIQQAYLLIYSLRDALQQIRPGERSNAAASVSIVGNRGTTSTSYVMMGYALQLTLKFSTRAVVTITGQMGNTMNGAETDVNLVWGTGIPPVLGAPLVGSRGTLTGQAARFIAQSAGGFTPFSISVLLDGLTIGETYWIDAAVQVNKGQSILSEVDLLGFTLIDPLGT